MSKIRWGLLSTANINKALIPAIRQSERGDLVAVASRSAESANAYAEKWGISKAFPTYQSMIDSGQVDAVYIGLPNSLHAEWSIKSMEAGVHVLCEKPFALSLAEVDAMIAASEKTGRVLMEAFMYRYHPQTKIWKELLKSGKIGDVYHVTGSFSFKLDDLTNVRMIKEIGGGSLWDVGVYPLSLAQHVFDGPPVRVMGMQVLNENGVDVNFSGQMEYVNGSAIIQSSFRTPFQQHIRILGTGGHVEIERPFNNLESREPVIRVYDEKDYLEEIPIPEDYLYLGEVDAIHAAVLDGTPPLVTLAETRNHVKTALALYKSAQESRVVHLDELEA